MAHLVGAANGFVSLLSKTLVEGFDCPETEAFSYKRGP